MLGVWLDRADDLQMEILIWILMRISTHLLQIESSKAALAEYRSEGRRRTPLSSQHTGGKGSSTRQRNQRRVRLEGTSGLFLWSALGRFVYKIMVRFGKPWERRGISCTRGSCGGLSWDISSIIIPHRWFCSMDSTC